MLLKDFSKDILFSIALYLDIKLLYILSCCNNKIKQIYNSEYFWELKYQNDFPNEICQLDSFKDGYKYHYKALYRYTQTDDVTTTSIKMFFREKEIEIKLNFSEINEFDGPVNVIKFNNYYLFQRQDGDYRRITWFTDKKELCLLNVDHDNSPIVLANDHKLITIDNEGTIILFDDRLEKIVSKDIYELEWNDDCSNPQNWFDEDFHECQFYTYLNSLKNTDINISDDNLIITKYLKIDLDKFQITYTPQKN